MILPFHTKVNGLYRQNEDFYPLDNTNFRIFCAGTIQIQHFFQYLNEIKRFRNFCAAIICA